ncbi:response regulator transcription factor [Roseomonas sp. BN140053]|uniref:response regulator transcription factor n=1 Tax=Roseomonas sp. BN140053 TaxID=3391898 RepID=UPI0039ECE376
MRVLVVEDDPNMARGLRCILRAASMVADLADTGEEACGLAQLYDYDIVVLDLMLPDMEGYEVVRKLRASRIDTPVLILSGLSRPQAKVKGFGMGADDFIVKPFDQAELIARIQAIVRRTKGFSQPTLEVGELSLDLGSHEVAVAGRPVHLTGKEYAILELLMLRRGAVLTKEAFLNHLYGGMDEPEGRIIDVFISNLRKKLSQAGCSDLIGTVWGRGHVLRGPMGRANGWAATPPAFPGRDRWPGVAAVTAECSSRPAASRRHGTQHPEAGGAPSWPASQGKADRLAETATHLDRSEILA